MPTQAGRRVGRRAGWRERARRQVRCLPRLVPRLSGALVTPIQPPLPPKKGTRTDKKSYNEAKGIATQPTDSPCPLTRAPVPATHTPHIPHCSLKSDPHMSRAAGVCHLQRAPSYEPLISSHQSSELASVVKALVITSQSHAYFRRSRHR